MSIDYKKRYHKWKHKYLQIKESQFTIGKDAPRFLIEHKFPLIKDVDRDKTRFQLEKLRLMAGNDAINMISDAIEERLGTNIIINNITPMFGSDLLNMAFRFQNMIAINEKPDDLKHNIDLYDLSLRIKIINEPILPTLKKTEQEVIYTDGFFLTSKTIDSKSRIYIDDNVEISELANLYKERSKLFVYRVPTNYDFNYMFTKISSAHYEVFSYKKNKIDFYFVFVMSKMI